MILSKRQPRPRVYAKPDRERILETAWVKLCGVCRREWQAEAISLEDGIEKCPNCLDGSRKADLETLARETAYAASREPKPQFSQAPLTTTFPGTIVRMTDADGNRVYQSTPLRLIKTVTKQLLLVGRDFSATDTITGATNLTIAVASRTAALTTLDLTAESALEAGDTYGITFNGVDFNNILSVR